MRIAAKKSTGKKTFFHENLLNEDKRTASSRAVFSDGNDELLTWSISLESRTARFSVSQKGLLSTELRIAGAVELAGDMPRLSELAIMDVAISPIPSDMAKLGDQPAVSAVFEKDAKWTKAHPNFKATLLSLKELQDILANGIAESDVETFEGGGKNDILKNYMLSLGCMAGCLAAYTAAMAGILVTAGGGNPNTLAFLLTGALITYITCLLGCEFAFVVSTFM
ncbi:MAG: hypothetical protein AB7P20_03105 [Rhizobiaceae bacterium]